MADAETRVARFARGFAHVPARGGPGVVRGPGIALQLPSLSLSFERRLAELPCATSMLVDMVAGVGPAAVETLRALSEHGALEDVVVDVSGAPLAVARRPSFLPSVERVRGPVRLSAQVFVLPKRSEWLLLGIGTRVVVAFTDDAVTARLRDLATPQPVEALSPLGLLLFENGLLTPAGEEPLSTWSFADALFHAVSVHAQGTESGYGTKPMEGANGRRARPPGSVGGGIVHLPSTVPPLDKTFVDVLADRRTRRDFSDKPIDEGTLGALLQLALRTQRRSDLPGGDYAAFHPYPSGGACDEIRTIVAHRGGHGLGATLAFYSNHEHCLARIDLPAERCIEVIDALCAVTGIDTPRPSVGLLFVADYDRMAAKYDAIAYATILRNVGGIYQTVSLVAEALGLACCLVGGGWSALERRTLAEPLDGQVLVGGLLLGWPAAR